MKEVDNDNPLKIPAKLGNNDNGVKGSNMHMIIDDVGPVNWKKLVQEETKASSTADQESTPPPSPRPRLLVREKGES